MPVAFRGAAFAALHRTTLTGMQQQASSASSLLAQVDQSNSPVQDKEGVPGAVCQDLLRQLQRPRRAHRLRLL